MWKFKDIDKSIISKVTENSNKQLLDTTNYSMQMYLAVLRELELGPQIVKKLSKNSNIPTRTLLKILDELEKKNFVKIQKSI